MAKHYPRLRYHLCSQDAQAATVDRFYCSIGRPLTQANKGTFGPKGQCLPEPNRDHSYLWEVNVSSVADSGA